MNKNIETRNETNISPQDEVITPNGNSRAILSSNANCSGSGLSSGKTLSYDGSSEKRKLETSDGSIDLLEELENSSPEDYIYLQSLSSSINHNTPRKIGRDSIKKRPKLSPSLSKNKIEIANGISSEHEVLHVKVKINKLRKCNEPRVGTSAVLKSSSEQNQSNVKVPDIENLTDLFNDDCDDWLTSTW